MKYGIKFEARAARLAKELGYTQIASVVKSVFYTTYHNINSCDEVIESGRWEGAYNGQSSSGWHGPHGVNGNHIDWSITIDRRRLHEELREIESAEK